MQLWVFSVSNVWVEIHHSVLRYLWSVGSILSTLLLICVLLNAFESKVITEVKNADLKMLLEAGEKRSSRCKTFKCSEMLLEEPKAGRFAVASTRQYGACLLKYYPRRPCTPSFIKSRMLRPLQTHFLLFQHIFFILVCIHAGNPRVPPQVWPLGQNPAGATILL